MIGKIHSISQISFTKIFQPQFQTEVKNNITIIRTYNPKHNTNLKKIHSCLDKIKSKALKTCFQEKKKVVLSTTQLPSLPKLLTKAKIERLSIPKQIKQAGLFPYANCVYHKNFYFKECSSFSFKSKNK